MGKRGKSGEMASGLVTAVRTLTILPFPGREAEQYSSSLYWFPVVGLLLGGMQLLPALAALSTGWNELAAFLVVAAGIALTRGLHADGLADCADGFFGGRTKDAALRIMKDPAVGSFGALALVCVMLLKWIVLVRLAGHHAFGGIVAGIVLARQAQVLLAVRMPYARTTEGTASAFVTGAGIRHLLVSAGVTIPAVFALMQFDVACSALLLLAALLSALLVGTLSHRKIGGVTGDVLGACSEITETLVWLAAAVTL